MALKLLLFGCLVTTSLVAAERYGVSRGRQDGFGGHGGHGGHGGGFGGHGGHGGGFGGHGHPPPHGGHGHPPPHGGPGHGGHGHGGHGDFHSCGGGGCHRPPPHDPHHGHDHFHPQEPKQPPEPHPQEPLPLEPKNPPEPHPLEPKNPPEPNQLPIPEIEVNFIVHEPEGLEVWIVKQSEVVFFGIELYVNTEPPNTKCDVCTNTTVITNGKLLIEDVDVVVKKGDVLYYYALIGNGHSVVRQKLQVLHITESLIGKCNCPGTSDIQDIDIRFNEKGPRAAREIKFLHFDPDEPFYTIAPPAAPEEIYQPKVLSKEEEKLSDELDELKRDHFFLGRIIDFMSNRKGCAARLTNYLLLQELPFPATRTSELEAFLRSYFRDDDDLQKLVRAIREVKLASEGQGIEFEMENYVDKQMVLYWTRHKRLKAPVVDPDFIEIRNNV